LCKGLKLTILVYVMNAHVTLLVLFTGLFMLVWDGDQNRRQAQTPSAVIQNEAPDFGVHHGQLGPSAISVALEEPISPAWKTGTETAAAYSQSEVVTRVADAGLSAGVRRDAPGLSAMLEDEISVPEPMETHQVAELATSDNVELIEQPQAEGGEIRETASDRQYAVEPAEPDLSGTPLQVNPVNEADADIIPVPVALADGTWEVICHNGDRIRLTIERRTPLTATGDPFQVRTAPDGDRWCFVQGLGGRDAWQSGSREIAPRHFWAPGSGQGESSGVESSTSPSASSESAGPAK
jgi:hypothetical protein